MKKVLRTACKSGRVKGTYELVAHENYIVILQEDAKTVAVLNVLHSRQKWPEIVRC